MSERAGLLLHRAEQDAGGPGRHWLWIADLARLAGAEDRAVEIETRLLKAEVLPVIRVPALLEAVEARQGRDIAGGLAAHVAAYSDHPVVLQRVIRWADARGDSTSASAFRTRLHTVSAGRPAGN